MDDRLRFRQSSPPTRLGRRAIAGLEKADPTYRTTSSGGSQMKPSTMLSAVPGTGGATPPVKPATISAAGGGGSRPSTISSTGGSQLPPSAVNPVSPPASRSGAGAGRVPKKRPGYTNILGMYHFGHALGSAAGSPTGGAQAAGMISGRAVAKIHHLLNRRARPGMAADAGQREAQLQRQQYVSGSYHKSILDNALPVRPGIRRVNHG